jgi:hypothetical protein
MKSTFKHTLHLIRAIKGFVFSLVLVLAQFSAPVFFIFRYEFFGC